MSQDDDMTVEEMVRGIEAMMAMRWALGCRPCPGCGTLAPRDRVESNHICPKRHRCLDCGEPADLFIGDPEEGGIPFDLSDQEAVDRSNALSDDWPICDGCLQARCDRRWEGPPRWRGPGNDIR